MAELPDSLYVPDGPDRFVPTELTRGPWSRDAQHGGPPTALLAGLIDAHEPSGSRVARLTVELLRPVPLAPLDVRIETVRPGRKVQLVQASLLAGGTEVARVVALRIRSKPVEVDEPAPEPVPEHGAPSDFLFESAEVMYGDAFELRRPGEPPAGIAGPRVVWFRLRVPVVAGSETSPLERLAATADFPNGISSVVPWDARWTFINPDLTVHVARPPRGEWIGLDARTVPGDDGIAFAEAALFDERGRVGRSVQSVLLAPPERP